MNDYRPHLLEKLRSKPLMRIIRGADTHIPYPCTLRIASFIPGRTCSGTACGNHLPISWGKGTSTKVTDMAVASGCAACHAILDGHDPDGWAYIVEHYPAALAGRLLDGLTETHALLLRDGIIQVKAATFE